MNRMRVLLVCVGLLAGCDGGEVRAGGKKEPVNPVVKFQKDPKDVATAFTAYMVTLLCRSSSQLLSQTPQRSGHDKFLQIINVLITLIDTLHKKSMCDHRSRKNVEPELQTLAQLMLMCGQIPVAGGPESAQGEVLRHKEPGRAVIILQVGDQKITLDDFFAHLVAYAKQEVPNITKQLDDELLPLKNGNKALLGLVTVPSLPQAPNVNEHEASLTSVLVESWNFLSVFMNNEQKHEYIVEQSVMLLDYVREHLSALLVESCGFESHGSLINITININL